MRTIHFFFLVFFLVIPHAACGSSGTGGTGGTGGETTTNPCIVNPESCMGTCAGECAPVPHGFAKFQMYLWSGPAGSQPPACPSETPRDSPGYLDQPPDSVSCSECTCGPSQGACFPPSAIEANGAACPANASGVQHTSFDAPPVWDGTCNAQNPVTAADSVTISSASLGPPAACAPSGVTATDIQGGKTISRICTSFSPLPDGKCPGDRTCTYAKVEGFSVCVPDFDGEDVPCPPGWPVRHVHYDESELCNCSCGDPVGESCSTMVTVYQDGACTKPLGSATVSAGKPAACVDLPPGSALGSKSATPPAYNAGTCAPKLTKNHPWTLCCLP